MLGSLLKLAEARSQWTSVASGRLESIKFLGSAVLGELAAPPGTFIYASSGRIEVLSGSSGRVFVAEEPPTSPSAVKMHALSRRWTLKSSGPLSMCGVSP